mmetsp:Transcript_10902/g.11036  ORF Transcript_10902/g.11036 Transcript_10902/m.11036 type:complete len:107 (-) Transcript_10902:93-413(-)
MGYSIVPSLKSLASAFGTDELLWLGHDAFPFIMLLFLLLLFLIIFLLLFIVILLLVVWWGRAGSTLPMASEVGLLALKALIVVEVVEGKLPQIVMVFTLRVLQSLI